MEGAQVPPFRGTVAAAAISNFTASVFLILFNKLLFRGTSFPFPTLLSCLHFLSTSLGLRVLQRFGIVHVQPSPSSPKQKRLLLIVAFAYAMSIPLNNATLLYNNVGFYQLSKVAIAPVAAFAEFFFLEKRFKKPALAGLVLTCAGVSLSTVDEVAVNPVGVVIAVLSILSTVAYQFLIRKASSSLKLSGLELVYHALPYSIAILLVLCPFADPLFSAQVDWTPKLVAQILTTCVLSVVLNWSLFALLGSVSPVTFNVMGHAKTVAVLLVAFLYFGEAWSLQKLCGLVIAIAGMIVFSR
eukprot:ANDGO_06014.mRNA.1 putative membrane protein At1g06890